MKLEPDAPPAGTGAVYDRSADGPTHIVSLLPGDVTPAEGEQAFYKGTSKDATAVAFTIKGVLYVRVDNEETLEVAGGEPTFAGISDDGRYVFYVAGGNIHRFDTTDESDGQVNATGDGEVVNLSADGSHVYFISKSQIGGKGTAGQPNMYVWSGGSTEFVATVVPSDLELTSGTKLQGYAALANWTAFVANPNGAKQGPGAEASRTTPDGSVLVFESHAQLTAYDNDAHTEIYRYDDGDKSLVCVSCNSLAEPATGDARLQELTFTGAPTVIHNVSEDGSRAFFETSEALVERDSDGVNDIYEWQEEEGGGTAVDLISSGESLEYPLPKGAEAAFVPIPNVLLSVTPDGEDVVFLSQDVLVQGAGEGGAQAIYNARVNGGFPPPPEPEICVEEEECKGPPQPVPSLLGSQSEGLASAGNVKPFKRKPHCKRPKHRKHKHCKKAKKRSRSARAKSSAASSSTTPISAPPAPGPGSAAVDDAAKDPQASTALGPITAAGPFDEYGIKSVSASESTTVAGMHPDFTTNITLNHFINGEGRPESDARTEEVSVSLPPGLLGNVNALPKCKTGQLVAWANCPIDSQIGVTVIRATIIGNGKEPIYNLEPPHPEEEIARFGFYAGIYPVFIDVKVRTASDYGATATVHSAPGLAALLGAKTTIWGNPADPVHDTDRVTALEAANCPSAAKCFPPGGSRPSGLPPTAFLSNPSACGPIEVGFAVKSYQLPGKVFTATAPVEPGGQTTECSGLPFEPSFTATPTNPTAGQPTGLKTTLTIPQQSTEAVNSPSTATMKEARITLPQGMTLAAGAADGLEACSEEQVGYHEEVDAACPDASKVGVASVESDLLPRPLNAELFLRTPRPGHLFGLWLVSDDLGLHVKVPGELEPDKGTGQLTAIFSDLPQVPISAVGLHVWGGGRAPLAVPDDCGTTFTTWSFKPHSDDPPVTGQSPMTIDQGCGARGFSPRLHAGTTNPVAGAYSPFVFDLQREDTEQNLAALDIHLPDGLLAKLKGVPLCPEEAVASGSCPAESKLGSVIAAAGPGPNPIWLPQPGKAPTAVYLAGPYKSAPFSILAVVPAQAGPFDLGNVVVRSALKVDPETAKATVASDPLPQFVEGVAAVYRRIHVVVDRPEFTLNPTDCREMAIGSHLTSTKGAVAEPSARFQVDGCKDLGFKPQIAMKLKGGTKRGEYPALSATVKARKGDANIGRVSVALPHSEFLAQEHIATICTRVQFAAGTCPKGSVYGHAKAWTPLLDKPLEGPVYMRANGGERELPDLVMSLQGEIDVALVGYVDSDSRGGIRTTFATVPDAPVTKFALKMKGGGKSLLVNSTDLCRRAHRSTVRMGAQNGRVRNSRSVLKAAGCKGG